MGLFSMQTLFGDIKLYFFQNTNLNLHNKWLMLMKAFIAWLNLDFGIETCFALGLTGYAKTWLQFFFPLYIWSVAGLMILLAHNSKAMTKIFGKNCVQVLTTLFFSLMQNY